MTDSKYPHWTESPPLDFDAYNKVVEHAFPQYAPDFPLASGLKLSEAGLGLAEEAGEVNRELRRVLFREQPLDQATTERIILELGDVYSWLNYIAVELGSNMGEVVRRHANKIAARYPKNDKD